MASKCKACGDGFTDDDDLRIHILEINAKRPGRFELHYCLECANEIYRGQISKRPAKLFSSGAGCPLEPNIDDPSPWEENNIRTMEGD